MKYLKLFEENKNFERFIVCEDSEHGFIQIWEVLGHNEITDKFTLIIKYEYTGSDTNNEIRKKTETKGFDFTRFVTYNDVIFKTNDLEEALEFMKMRIDAKKYNL